MALGRLGEGFVLLVLHLPPYLFQAALAKPIEGHLVYLLCLCACFVESELGLVLMLLTSLLVVSLLSALHISSLQLLNYKVTSTKWRVAKMKRRLLCGSDQITRCRKKSSHGCTAYRARHNHWSRRRSSWRKWWRALRRPSRQATCTSLT